MENNNSVVENSYCKKCHLGINPFFYFYSNKVDPNDKVYYEYKSILTKKFGLIKGKNCNVHVCCFFALLLFVVLDSVGLFICCFFVCLFVCFF